MFFGGLVWGVWIDIDGAADDVEGADEGWVDMEEEEMGWLFVKPLVPRGVGRAGEVGDVGKSKLGGVFVPFLVIR